MTNFEKIKAMTIEEMTEWCEKISDDENEEWESLGCYHCINHGTHHYPKDCGDCEWLGGIRKWLDKEVEVQDDLK